MKKNVRKIVLAVIVLSLVGINAYAAYEQITCPTCYGTGRISCNVCGGYGKIEKTNANGRTSYVNCSRCGGDGKLKCTDCNGTGHIRKWVEKKNSN
jgi:DnaJ-class molecular chaperone